MDHKSKKLRKWDEKALKTAQILPMNKRGLGYLAVAVVLFLLLLAGYIVSGIFRGLETPIETMTAVEYESGTGYYASGYIVREETVLTSEQTITNLVLSEGQMAALGQPVAMGYASQEAQQRQQEISRLTDELVQLQYAAGTSAAVYDQASMDAKIRDELVSVAVLLGKGRIADVRDAAPELKGLILRRGMDENGLQAIEAEISAVEAEIASLRSQLGGSVATIRAAKAGYFSGTTDGFESVLTPKNMTAMSVSDVANLEAGAKTAGAIGKIISGDTWYYLAAVPMEHLKGLSVGQTVTVTFAQALSGSISMDVFAVGQEENGKAVLILECSHYLQDMTLARQQSADIAFTSLRGLRLPKEAVHVKEDGSVGVYVLESTRANWKPVEILLDNGETYLVALDKSSTQNLWPGDEVIVSGVEGLTDGKVVL